MSLGSIHQQVVQEASVLIGSDNSGGSGFFVAPGQILTCAHVINSILKQVDTVRVRLRNGTILSCLPARIEVREDVDLALLQVEETDSPVLKLGSTDALGEECFVYGYPEGRYREGDSILLTYEGPYGKFNEGLKFKGSRVTVGFSGSAVVSQRTGNVIGVLSRTMSENHPIGGRAIPTEVIVKSFPRLTIPDDRAGRNNTASLPFEHIECVGRDSEIARVTKAAIDHATVLVFGEPGIGKSLVASKAAARLRSLDSDSGTVQWIDASDVDQPIELIDRILSTIIATANHPKDKNIYSFARKILSGIPNITLIIDSIQSDNVAANAIGKGIPGNVRVIGTSNSRLSIFKERIRLLSLSPEDSHRLFLMGLDDPHPSVQDTNAIERICEAVEFHPLAISLLSAKCASESLPPEDLATKLTDELSIWKETQQADLDQGSLLNISISSSVQQLTERELLTLVQIVFSPRNVTLPLITEAVAFAFGPEPAAPIGSLVRRNLISRTNNILSTHSLVRGYVASSNSARKLQCQSALVLATASTLPNFTVDSWDIHSSELFSFLMDIADLSGDLTEQTQRLLLIIQLWMLDDSSPLALLSLLGLLHRSAQHIATSIDEIASDLRFPASLSLANFLRSIGNHDAAISLLHSIVDEALPPEEEAHVRISIANATMMVNGFEESAIQLLRARNLARSVGSDILLASSTGQLGRLAFEMQLFAPALQYYRSALHLYEKWNHLQGISACNHYLGIIARNLGFYEDTITHLRKAIEVDRELQDPMGELQSLSELAKTPGCDIPYISSRLKELATRLEGQGTKGGVGKARFLQGDLIAYSGVADSELSKALPHYEAALAAFELAQDTLSVSQVLGQIGLTMYWLDRLEEAEQYTHRALQSYSQTGNSKGIGLSLVQMAHILIKRGRPETAERILWQSIPVLTEVRSGLMAHVTELLDDPAALNNPDCCVLARGNPSGEIFDPTNLHENSALTEAFASARVIGYEDTLQNALPLSLALMHPFELPIHTVQAGAEEGLSENEALDLIRALHDTRLIRDSSLEKGRLGGVRLLGDLDDLPTSQVTTAVDLAAKLVSLAQPNQLLSNQYLLEPKVVIALSLRLNGIGGWLHIKSDTLDTLVNNATSLLTDDGSPAAAVLCLEALFAQPCVTCAFSISRAALENNLGTVFGALEMYKEAIELLRHALDHLPDHVGIDEKNELEDLRGKITSNLGHQYLGQGEYERAWEHFRNALIVHQKVNGIVHRSTAIDLCNLGQVRANQGNAVSSIILYKRALAIWASLGLSSDREAIMVNVHMAAPLFGIGKTQEAEAILRQACEALEQEPYAFSLDHFQALKRLSLLLMATDRHSEAKQHLSTAQVIANLRFGSRTGFHREVIELIETCDAAPK